MFKYFKSNKDELIKSLLDVENNNELFARITTLQNEINISYDTKIIAIALVDSDILAAAMAKTLADAYALNNSNALIIDANLYNPCLEELVKSSNNGVEPNTGEVDGSFRINRVTDKVTTICMDKQIYPTDI